MINGFERPSQVRAALAAFEHERTGGAASDLARLAAIAEQEAIFRAELERMEAEVIKDPPPTGRTPRVRPRRLHIPALRLHDKATTVHPDPR